MVPGTGGRQPLAGRKQVTHRLPIAVTVLAGVLAGAAPIGGQGIEAERRVFEEVVLRPAGQPVVPFFDGWYQNPDGTYSLCFGYYNLNTEEIVDVPLGPSNLIEPSEFDGGQPTHFLPAPEEFFRYWCVFTVQVPEDFGNRDVWWTISSNGQKLEVPGRLNPAYVLDEPASPGREAIAPLLRLDDGGPEVRGRNGVTARPRSVAAGDPLTLTAWVGHTEPGTWVAWSKHQGPGDVSISEAEQVVQEPEGTSTVTVRFTMPGEYLLLVQAMNDAGSGSPTGGFEFLCCWTNGYFPVVVR